ncbi:hypothetical protein C4J81_07395 [Deltaproteobacteria bacterium Smac51]|nr:hypothetical protein C4J81_07395 [Deltaproteobacteria bacterium Smac51]
MAIFQIKNKARPLFPVLTAMLTAALFIMAQPAWAMDEDMSHLSPLTQADIDAYVEVLPRLTPEVTRDAPRANKLLIDAKISKKRLVYVGAKVAIAQAMAIGAMNAQQLTDNNVPLYLHPSPEEIALVTTNLHSLSLAQETARRAAAGIGQ